MHWISSPTDSALDSSKRHVLNQKFFFFALTITTAISLMAVFIGAGIVYSLIEAQSGFSRDLEQISRTSSADIGQLFNNQELDADLLPFRGQNFLSFDQLPKSLLYSVIMKEDRNFFRHRGFDPRGIARAFWHNITGQYFSGGSTITQQLAGSLYTERSILSVWRKLIELWHSFHLEQLYSKNEIFELYANTAYFGYGAYGVEDASRLYFGHSATGLTPAESALLAVLLASPRKYSPIENPQAAMIRQKELLTEVSKRGFISIEDADASFAQFWLYTDFAD